MGHTSAACIERKHALSADEFLNEHLRGQGLPVIVTDATDDWNARAWSFDFFSENYGFDGVIVTDRLVKPTVTRKVLLCEYMDYVLRPESSRLASIQTPSPLYMNHYSPFVPHPELLDEFRDPYFVDNWFRNLTGAAADWYNDEFGWVFIGPAGTITPLHRDLFSTHAWLAQIHGRKRFFLFAPDDGVNLGGDGLNPAEPDLEKFPEYTGAHPFEVVLHPGEVLFIPANWYHYVVSLDPSISLTFNFINAANFGAHFMSTVTDLPAWSRKLDKARLRTALGFQWQCKGWDQPA
jgi:hypothetical protein